MISAQISLAKMTLLLNFCSQIIIWRDEGIFPNLLAVHSFLFGPFFPNMTFYYKFYLHLFHSPITFSRLVLKKI